MNFLNICKLVFILKIFCFIIRINKCFAKLLICIFILCFIVQLLCWLIWNFFCEIIYFNFINSYYFCQSAGVIMKKWLANIIKILRCKFQKHFKFLPPDFLHHILLIKSFLERRLCFSSGDIFPTEGAHHWLYKI